MQQENRGIDQENDVVADTVPVVGTDEPLDPDYPVRAAAPEL